ncbi:MAG: carbon-nitrogen hydrolase family protein [Myxococcales bacterium]|nr:carbon-nitrogen hydrolase family protein [Myxococcales bacterium]
MTTRDGVAVAAIQMTSTGDVEANLESALALSAAAADDGAALIVLPECFAYLGPEEGKLAIAEPLPGGGPILARLSAFAAERGVELLLGGFWERAEDPARVRNACVHLDQSGQVRAVYRKIHLFDVDLADGTKLEESATVEAGSEPVVTDSALGRLGLSVCYDLRFPELYRALVDRGAIALAVPAAFTLTTGKDHWHVLLRARAIEAQCYVIAAAQTGHHYGPRVSYGHALICDPWGTVISECGEGPGYALARVDAARVDAVRRQVPSLQHRRLR